MVSARQKIHRERHPIENRPRSCGEPVP
jgi:hypothetical protein